MDEKIKNLWANNKLLFFIALPLIILFVFRDLILSLLVGSARKVSAEAKKEEEKLQTEINQADKDAAVARTEADAAGKRVEDRKEDDISEDWNKKK